MKQKIGMCIGGPWDGKWWPLEGSGCPSALVRKPMSTEWSSYVEPPTFDGDVVHYRREHLTHRPSGTAAFFFVADGVSIAAAAKIADERFPQGAFSLV